MSLYVCMYMLGARVRVRVRAPDVSVSITIATTTTTTDQVEMLDRGDLEHRLKLLSASYKEEKGKAQVHARTTHALPPSLPPPPSPPPPPPPPPPPSPPPSLRLFADECGVA